MTPRSDVEHSKKDADVLIAPAVGDVAMLDFTQKKRCMQAGIEAARQAAPGIRKAVDACNVSPRTVVGAAFPFPLPGSARASARQCVTRR